VLLGRAAWTYDPKERWVPSSMARPYGLLPSFNRYPWRGRRGSGSPWGTGAAAGPDQAF